MIYLKFKRLSSIRNYWSCASNFSQRLRHLSQGDGWFTNFSLSSSDKVESQSDLLSTSAHVFELQFHSVKLEHLADYLKRFEVYVKLLADIDVKASLIGSWSCEVGSQNTVFNLWKYPNGYSDLSNHHNILKNNQELYDCRYKLNSMLYERKNHICLPFSFWPDPVPRPRKSNFDNIYELRTYSLKPGTMIEWGNSWARVIRLRSKNNEAVAGLFTHIGDLHVVHHLWTFRDFDMRRKCRDECWQDPSWGKCVMHTVPLVRHMTSSILRPNSFSLLQ